MSEETPQPPPPGKIAAQKKLERFVRAFDLASDNQGKLGEAIGDLAGIIDDETTGLISVLAVLVDEIRGLRKDLRQAAQAGGLSGIFDILRGGR